MVKQKTITIILSILLLMSLSYIGFIGYNNWRYDHDIRIFQRGMKTGYETAIIQIMEKASKCNEVPLYNENKTINLIAVECLKNENK